MWNVVKGFLPKQHQELPDAYGITIKYLDGGSEEIQAAAHFLANGLFEIKTSDDLVVWIPVTSIKNVSFDKRFSKMIAIKEQLAKEKLKKE